MPDLKPKAETVPEHLEPLWVSGLALLFILLGGALWTKAFHLYGESYEWAIYLTLGTLFPAVLLLLALPSDSKRLTPRSLSRINLALALLCVIASTYFIIRQRQYTAFALAILNLLVIVGLRKRAGLGNQPGFILISFFVLVLAWTLSARLLWWESFGKWFVSGSSWMEDVYRFFVCAVSLLLVSINLHSPFTSKSKARSRICKVADVVAVLIIGLASVRSDQLFNTMSYSHWSVIVGPAAMVRQGEWLLWDVPSQYGFLNVLAVALAPVKSVWQSTYIINSFLLFCSAVFLFFVLRLARPGLLNFFFALTVTLAAVFLIAGWPPALLGPQVFPSLGPFRFIWCYVLLFVLLLEFRTNSQRLRGLLLFAGCVVWLIGTLWSSESAVYAAAIWLPSYAMLVFNKFDVLDGPSNSRWRTGALWAIVPPVLLAVSVALIAGSYSLRLGHALDWRAFYEYSLAFAGGFFAIPIDVNGPVWVLFLIFCAFSTVTVFFLRQGLRHRAAGLIIGTWGALWSISSYFVSRSHPNNATVLSPILCVVMGLTIYLLATSRENDWWSSFVKLSFVPVLTVLLTITFGNASFLGLYLSSPKLSYEANIDSHLPGIDPSLLDLLNTAHVQTDDPIVYSAVRVKAIEPLADGLSHDHGVLLSAWPLADGRQVGSTYRTWLPTTPFVLFAPLPTERKQQYMARFVSRTRLSGWLIQNRKEAAYTSSPWFYNQIIRTHTPTKVFENSDWQLIWFEFKSSENEEPDGEP